MFVSVIIPSFNGQKLLQKYLPSVIAACAHWDPSQKNWQIIVVDDGSTDDTVTWVKQNYPMIKVVKNSSTLRFARAVNRGVKEARGEIVLLLNNDVKPDKNFLQPLLGHFDDPQVFAVGCLERNEVAGQTILGGRGVGQFSRGFLIHARAHDQMKPETLWVTAGSGAFRKSMWDKLGGFDPLFRPAYEEDRDLSYNALKAGYKAIFEPKAQVTHLHETSNLKEFGSYRIKIMSFKNQLLFVWKNISSSKLMLSHLLWLPYHLVVTTIKTKGLFLLGFFWAVTQLGEVIMSRLRAQKLWQLSDEQILHQFKV
ncbi:MAG: glycosyltransferase family 2 protein [Candidatus Chisholmbacteria bacterium]|nr:glycosyltransferase family 2 protein [Candidatus Chisholmbacteria bacterium]